LIALLPVPAIGIEMAQFVRGKQAGVGIDMSAGLVPELFALDNVARYGINSQTSAVAYDPVQSLFAVGTNDTRFGPGLVYVFGQKRVCAVLSPPRRASIRILQFCGDKLLCVDSKNEITIFSLNSKRIQASYTPPGHVTSLCTDPLLDYAFVGLTTGEVVAYDIDRESPAPFKIANLWREANPRAKLVSVVSLALHPRDIGTLLIGYTDGAVLYSFKQAKATQIFQYELPVGAPGGYSDPSSANKIRYPRLVQAVWHPTGTFILTGHDDESFVVWDPKTGKIITARTLQDTNVHQSGTVSASIGSTPGTFSLKAPLTRLAWCSKKNPDDTGILVAGGAPTNLPERGLTFFDLGPTPVYATSSWQILSDHFNKPKAQSTLPTPPHIDVASFCLLPRSSPHYAGCHDPVAIAAILSSGEITTLSFPSGHPITPTNQLHPSVSFVHPFINKIAVAPINRTRWLGMMEKRQTGPPLVTGGATAERASMRFENRNVVQTSHADGTVRIWDAGHGDCIENEDMMQADVGRALNRREAIEIAEMSMAGATGELAVGMRSGEVLIFRYDKNKNFDRQADPKAVKGLGLESITTRADPDLKEGLLPLTLLSSIQAPVTALKLSDVGFCAAGFANGSIAIIDLRGPALIYEASITALGASSKRGLGSIRRHSGQQQQAKAEWATRLEFGVMKLDGEDYSSIILVTGTNTGRVATFKLLPDPNGSYSVQLAGSTNVEDEVVAIEVLNADTGVPAYASQRAVAGLREGIMINGVVLVVSKTGARIFKPPGAKGASKSWNEFFCDSAAVVRSEDRAALVGVFGDGCARTFTLPALKEVSCVRIDPPLETRRLPEAVVTPSGNIFGWTGPSEIAIVNPWGGGLDTTRSDDMLLNPNLATPPRPTISNVQWLSGTQHVTPVDMDTLIGGPGRPPSKRMIEQMRSEERQRAEDARSGAASTHAAANQKQDEGYWAYMQKQMTQRTQNMNIMGDSMNNLEESSGKFAEDVNKWVSSQKKKAVMGSKFSSSSLFPLKILVHDKADILSLL
jgi:syntaxin-binding protein 5